VGRAGQGSAGFTPGAGTGTGQGIVRQCAAQALRRVIVENRRRLERDLGEYWGALASKSITEAELHEKAKANSKIQPHVLGFIAARDKAQYVLDLFDRYVVHNSDFPPCADVSFLLRQTLSSGGKVLLEGPQSYFLSNAAEKFWDSGTSANTDAAGMLCAARVNIGSQPLSTLAINIHKTPGPPPLRCGLSCETLPRHVFRGSSKALPRLFRGSSETLSPHVEASRTPSARRSHKDSAGPGTP